MMEVDDENSTVTGGGRSSDKESQREHKRKKGHTFNHHRGATDSRQVQVGTFIRGTIDQGNRTPAPAPAGRRGGRRSDEESQRECERKEGHTFKQHGGATDSREVQVGTFIRGTINQGNRAPAPAPAGRRGGRRYDEESQRERERKEGHTFKQRGGATDSRQVQVGTFIRGTINQGNPAPAPAPAGCGGGRRSDEESQRERERKEGHTFKQYGGATDSRQDRVRTFSSGTINQGNPAGGAKDSRQVQGGTFSGRTINIGNPAPAGRGGGRRAG